MYRKIHALLSSCFWIWALLCVQTSQKPCPRDSGVLRNHCGLQGTFPGALPLTSPLQPCWNGKTTPLSTHPRHTDVKKWSRQSTSEYLLRKGINMVIWTCHAELVWSSHTKVLLQRCSLVLSSPNSTRSPRVWHLPAASTIIHPPTISCHIWVSFRLQITSKIVRSI